MAISADTSRFTAQHIVGMVLADPADCLPILVGKFGPRLEHFPGGRERDTLKTILRLREAGTQVDAFTVSAALDGNNHGKDNFNYVSGLMNDVVSSAHFEANCNVLRTDSHKKALCDYASELARISRNGSDDADIKLRYDRLGQLINDFETAINPPRELNPLDQADRLLTADAAWSTGFNQLNDLLDGGLRPGTLYVVGAGPGGLKSTLSRQLAYRIAFHSRIPAHYASAEESPGAQILKHVCRLGRASLSQVRANSKQYYEHFNQIAEMYQAGLLAWLEPPLSIARMKAAATKQMEQVGTAECFVVVDSLQKTNPATPHEYRRQEIDCVLHELEAWKQTVPVCILAISELSRGDSANPYGPGRGLQSFKESSEIEYSADVALLLEFAKEDYELMRQGQRPREITLYLNILKNRHGCTGSIRFCVDLPTGNFEEVPLA